MIARLLSLDTVTAIAHRGGSKLRPENTLTAFAHAEGLQVDAFECDVHLSRDGVPVVIHDATLERTTDATGRVASYTAAELAGVDAGARFGADAGAPYRERVGGVPRLADLLERFADRPWIIEIKGEDPAVALRALDVVRESGAEGRVVVGGFSHTVLTRVRAWRPDTPTSASSLECRAGVRRALFGLRPRRTGFDLFQVPFRLRGQQMFGRRFVRAARRAGVPVQAWIVDDPDDMRQLLHWGVTGLISDRPDLAVIARDQSRHAAQDPGETPIAKGR